jgi:hypothetical protein
MITYQLDKDKEVKFVNELIWLVASSEIFHFPKCNVVRLVRVLDINLSAKLDST